MSSQSAALRNRKQKKSKKDGPSGTPDLIAPSKQEKEIAKYLRFNLKNKEGICMGNQVHYFAGAKAVDLLMSSKWASATSKKDDANVLFTNRQSCLDYCQILLEKDMFRRVLRIRRQKKGSKKQEKESTDKENKPKKSKKQQKETDSSNENAQSPTGDEKDTAKEDDKKDSSKQKKPKKPAKLEPHEEQIFVDGGEKDGALYVWIFDPVSTKTWLMGITVIIGAIAACLYPLWPMQLRLGIYYICLGLIGLLGLLIALAIVRFIIFCGVWASTMGKKHWWLFPNLFEDCGFFESFQPVYAVTIPGEKKSKKTAKSDDSKADQCKETEKQNSSGEEKLATPETPTEVDSSKTMKDSATQDRRKPPKTDTETEKESGDESVGEESDASKFEMLHHSDFKQTELSENEETEEEED